MAHFVETPRTEAIDKTRYTLPDFSEMASFHAPADKDELFNAMRNPNGRNAFATPSARAPLAGRTRNLQAKNEFTPLLHSAAKKRMMMRDRESKENYGLATPAALKPGFQLSSPGVPDASMLDNSSMVSDHTPVPEVNSSSFEHSTPMALPNGQLDSGNVLTLREQEAKLEKIDKENFGLKLKIHFLEENLRKTGTEWSQHALRENTELKVTQMTMEVELKKYRKQLLQAERDLQDYKQQLHDYAENMQRRHADEAMNEELDNLREQLQAREDQLAEMQLRLDSAENTVQSLGQLEKLRDELADLEAEVRNRDKQLEERDEEIDVLKERLGEAEINDQGSEEKDREIEEQADRIEELEAEVQRQSREKEEELEALHEQLDAAKQQGSTELEDLRHELEAAQKDKRDQLRDFEAKLQAYNREKNTEIENLQRKVESAEKDKADEISSLELRVRLAESKGDNQSQLAQQAAEDARNQAKQIAADKELEIDDLRAQIQSMHGIQDELNSCQRQLQDYATDTEKRHQEDRLREEVMTKLRDAATDKDREIRQLKSSLLERESTSKESERMRETLSDRDHKVAALQRTIDAQATSLEDLRKTRNDLATREQELKTTADEVRQAKATVGERDRQLETLRKTLEDRNSELEILRQANQEPDTQIEGMQSIIRHRDSDLEELRDTIDELEVKLESLQVTANERLRTIDELRDELAEMKQNLEDEIQVLEATLDEAEVDKDRMHSQLKVLESQLEDTKEVQSRLSPMGKDLRAAQREKSRLERQIESLERDRDIANEDRASLQESLEELRRELQSAQAAPKLTPSRDREISSLRRQLEDLRAQLDKRTSSKDHMKELEDLVRSSTIDLEAVQLRLHNAEAELAKLPQLREQLRQKDRELEYLLADSTKQLHFQAQEGREESGRLRADIMGAEKKHAAELKGLAKQITFLRSRCERERTFREGLGFQKEWFLMNVEIYSECNQADLRLLEDMGITPSISIRQRQPSIKAVGQAIIFLARCKRLAGQWRENRRIQEQLVAKLETMRSKKPTAQTQAPPRRKISLGLR